MPRIPVVQVQRNFVTSMQHPTEDFQWWAGVAPTASESFSPMLQWLLAWTMHEATGTPSPDFSASPIFANEAVANPAQTERDQRKCSPYCAPSQNPLQKKGPVI